LTVFSRLFGRAVPLPVLPAHEAYERWAPTYPAVAHNPLMQAEQDVVAPLLAQVRATRALDIGTGSGRYLPALAQTGASRVLGLDFSMAMLVRGDATYPRVCADARRLPFRRSAFDLINASLMVGDVADLGAWSAELARVLARGGHLIYSDFHPSWADRGWQRTFRGADGDALGIAFQPHTIDEHLSALEQAGFRVLAIREPRLGTNGVRRRGGNPPVVVVFHAVKEGPSAAISDTP
jgi:ubiquinone/menaquinone biosynthesis C-methylase UbiE